MSTISELLTGLGAEIGMPDLALDEKGLLEIECNEDFTVHFEVNTANDVLTLASKIAVLPDVEQLADLAPLLQALLEANLYGAGTLGCTFGIDLETGDVLLSRNLYLNDLQLSQLINEFRVFVNATAAWTENIRNGFPRPQATPSKEAPQPLST